MFNWLLFIVFLSLPLLNTFIYTNTRMQFFRIYSVGGYQSHNNNIVIVWDTLSAVMKHYCLK